RSKHRYVIKSRRRHMADAPGVGTLVTHGLRHPLSRGVFTMPVKLFVGGLAFATSSDRLREAFAAIGTVESVRVAMDPAGQSRGFGFVEMETMAAAQDAISRLHGSDLDGRALKVELSQKKESSGGRR